MAKSKKKDGGQRYDWDLIKQDYIQDKTSTQQKMAEKYGVTLRLVTEHARKEHWLATKKEYQNKIANRVAEKVAEKIADIRAEAVTDLIKAAANISQKLTATLLNDAEQFNKYVVTENAPAPEGIGVVSVTYEKEFTVLNADNVQKITRSLKNLADVIGAETPAQTDKRRLEREKFEWEKQKALESNGQTNTETCGVVMMPPILGDES